MKKVLSLILILVLSFSLFSCDLFGTPDDKKDDDTSKNEPQEAGEAVAFVTVDINPSIEITLDENGIVASVYGANEDGQVLLYGEAEAIVGFSYEDAIAYITKLAVELGYLNKDTGDIETSVTAVDEEFSSTVLERLNKKIKETAKDHNVEVSVEEASFSFSLECDLAELKERYPDNEDIQKLTLAKYKLAVTVSEREGISVVAALEYDDEEMIKHLNAAHSKLESYATDAYLAAKREATRIFEKSMGIVVAGVYTEIYAKHAASHLGTFHYGAAYQTYKSAAITYRSIYEIKAFGDSMAEYDPSDEIVTSITELLSLEDTSVLENGEGKITLDSIVDFCDEFISEHESELSDDVKTQIVGMLIEARKAWELKNKATTNMYKADLQALKGQIVATVTSIKGVYNGVKLFMNDEQKADIDACIAELDAMVEKIDEIIEDGVTLSEIEALEAGAEIKAAEMLTKIEADLSESELEEVNAKIEELEAKQADLTKQFEDRLATAEAEARAKIEAARQERENKFKGESGQAE